jgi:PhnB protein
MHISVHLTFSGQCEAAFRFYERVLGAKLGFLLTYGNSPAAADTPASWRDKVVHASLTLGETTLAGSDALPGEQQTQQGFYVLLGLPDATAARNAFDALAQHGAVRMPLQETFWTPAFGVVIDQFGVPWEVSADAPPRERLTPPEV